SFLLHTVLSHLILFFFFIICIPPLSTLFPYTTLFRSNRCCQRLYILICFLCHYFYDRCYHKPIKLRMNNYIVICHSIQETVFLKDRKSTRLNSSHVSISYAVFCLKIKLFYYICILF